MKTEQAFNAIMQSSIFRLNGPDIDLCESLIALCDAINAEKETNWNLGECLECSIGDLLPGAYWALSEWHGGQSSPEYAALCSIGSIFRPGMSSTPTEESGEFIVYEMLGKYFETRNKSKV